MRRLLKDNRGQIRCIEAFFAAILLLSVLALIPKTPDNTNNSTETLSTTAYNTLLCLDSDGQIANLIENQSWTELKTLLQSALPVAVWFNVTVFNQNMAVVNDVPVCSGSAVSDRIIAVDYVCASVSGDYSVYLVRLQVAVVD
jgi:hypothetical protein